ncbi:MFS transporter [Shewanella baltica]|uniref:MFS transporter n=1 Tax=Shewanella baltica TaxID=62322 RepID=UPI0028712009|nr:MFS transporter [Shewanella baltica]MDR9767063.1 MFS transporter [Shewanella baltica]
MMKKENILLFSLSLAVFGIITTELSIIGLLPYVVQQFQVDIQQAGFLVSIYAIVVAFTGPFVTLFMSGWNRKYVLAGILALFVVSNLVYANTQEYSTMMIFRILPALVHAVFFSVTLVVATSMVAESEQANAAAKVFAGVAVGLVLGVPVSSFIAEQYSLSAAFYFGLTACAIALVSVLLLMENMPVRTKMSFGAQVNILRNPAMWLSLMTVVSIFAAMFSSYSYIAEYLSTVTGMSGKLISAMLMSFGIFGVVGNFIFGHLINANMLRAVVLYPIMLLVIFAMINFLGFSYYFMIAIIVFWGAVHSAGLLVSQTWIMDDAGDAHVFANSLFVSFSNLGITIGSAFAGWFIYKIGIENLFMVSFMFTALALVSILIKVKLYKVPSKGLV